ncbi:MAG: amidase [Nitrososphaeraceae archaeon]
MIKELMPSFFSLRQLSEGVMNGSISPVDLVEGCMERIRKFNPILNAFITVIKEDALKQAQLSEKDIRLGKYLGPLHGIPFSIKDIFYAKGIRCTAGSKILSNYVSEIDSTSVKKMKNAGAILIGTNNLNEFASGINGINPFYGSSKNPWNTSRISGGSSGGSSVAVATGMAAVSLGTDTGGSIRVPSSFCGVVGLKPTYGRISRYGVIPLSPSLDHIGCITRSAWDAAAVLECISGWDPLDKGSVNKRVPIYTKIIEDSRAEKFSVGIPTNYFSEFLHPEVERLFNDFIEKVRLANNVIHDVVLHNTEKYYRHWRDVRIAEASQIHLKWLKTRAEQYSIEVRNMLIQGTKVSAVEYIHAMNTIKEIKNEFLSILSDMCAIIVPTTIIPAPGFDERTISIDDDTFQTRKALLRNTIIFNSTGLPAVTIPIGLTKEGLPVGAQIIGPPFREDTILSIAYNYECTNNTASKFVPPLCT